MAVTRSSSTSSNDDDSDDGDVEFHLEGCARMLLKRSAAGDVTISSLDESSESASASASSSSSSSLPKVLSRVTRTTAKADASMVPSLVAAG